MDDLMSIRVDYTFTCDHSGCKESKRIGYEPQLADGDDVFGMLPSGWVLISKSGSQYFRVRCQEHAQP